MSDIPKPRDPVVTRPNRGQWEVRVPGRPELSRSTGSRDEAVDLGRSIADDLGVDHEVIETDKRRPAEEPGRGAGPETAMD